MRRPTPGTPPTLAAALWQLLEMGFLIAIPTVLGLLGGLYLDGRLGTAPWLSLGGLLLGLGAGVYGVYRLVATVTRAVEHREPPVGGRSESEPDGSEER